MKPKYSVDKNNQLIVKFPRKKWSLKPKGNFGIDNNNRLFYQVRESATWRKQRSLPPRITFKGSWYLSPNHDLVLILDKNSKDRRKDTLDIKGTILSLERDLLAFEVKSYDRQGLLHIRILKLNATLFADKENRICLKVKKLKPDTLILTGSWQLNKNQQIIYEYSKIDLETKGKSVHSLTFTGFWQISEANKLTYILKHSTISRFDFRAQIETPTIYPQKGLIKYRLGVGLREGVSRQKIITLYGAWKFNRNFGLVFEMDYDKEGIKQIEFGTDLSFQENTITFSLRDKKGEPLGLNVTFTHSILKSLDAKVFLRLKLLKNNPEVETGLKVPF